MSTIIDMAEWKKSRAPTTPRHTTDVQAIGPDAIALIHLEDGREVARDEYEGENLDFLQRKLQSAIRKARAWNMPSCLACGAKECHAWHTGLILERSWIIVIQGKQERVTQHARVTGKTAGGRWRLRPVDGGSPMYSTAERPSIWGRVVGYETAGD